MIDKALEKINLLLQGKIPQKIDLGEIADKQNQTFARTLNQLIDFMQETHDFIIPLSNGILTDNRISPGNFFGSPFKELNSRLAHLTWQAKQVADGDFNQRVDFMGDFSEAFNHMVTSLDNHEKELKRKISELEEALAHIKKLEGILPICSYCKKIRKEKNGSEIKENWVQMERYISDKTDAMFSHSICPECMDKFYPENN